eukprot:TRINITY_DN8416_c0_g1_i1.p1 TRINITY_DN8416_c0_g1~~TRINITY_DN8416_c0_g1_i1.p1  ORF type:complete len:356 (-),score=60.03 TRINITY_DN8416_c0_g1_i1:23-982(-)
MADGQCAVLVSTDVCKVMFGPWGGLPFVCDSAYAIHYAHSDFLVLGKETRPKCAIGFVRPNCFEVVQLGLEHIVHVTGRFVCCRFGRTAVLCEVLQDGLLPLVRFSDTTFYAKEVCMTCQNTRLVVISGTYVTCWDWTVILEQIAQCHDSMLQQRPQFGNNIQKYLIPLCWSNAFLMLMAAMCRGLDSVRSLAFMRWKNESEPQLPVLDPVSKAAAPYNVIVSPTCAVNTHQRVFHYGDTIPQWKYDSSFVVPYCVVDFSASDKATVVATVIIRDMSRSNRLHQFADGRLFGQECPSELVHGRRRAPVHLPDVESNGEE